MNKKAKKFDYVLAVIFVFLVIITIYPFLNVLAISFNDSTDTIKNVNFIIPRKFTLSNYKYVFKDGGIAMPAVISVLNTPVKIRFDRFSLCLIDISEEIVNDLIF